MVLKKRLEEFPIVRRKASKPAIVELITPPATPPECVIELEFLRSADPVEGSGAGVGDLFMSPIHTCELNRPTPSMPWNYRETLARLAQPVTA
ncbi:MAG TPA: hypothetical protein VEU96_24655 [Bryobacteraceae bacterium]|nr:hypothetical protein [Bryobacteraceae bacterium]